MTHDQIGDIMTHTLFLGGLRFSKNNKDGWHDFLVKTGRYSLQWMSVEGKV